MPNVTASDELVYVTEPETQTMHIVDLTKAEDGAEAVVDSVELSQVPNEVAVASGAVPEGADGGEDAVSDEGHDHEHEGHDHDH